MVNKKEISNEDTIYDFLNYTIGSLKCFTQSNSAVQKEAVKQKIIPLLAKSIDSALKFGINALKQQMLLV